MLRHRPGGLDVETGRCPASRKKGLDASYLASLAVSAPLGAAIEARVYAENPAKDFAPCPGTLQTVEWKELPGSRIDTWVYRGVKVSANYGRLPEPYFYREVLTQNSQIRCLRRLCITPKADSKLLMD
jgi:biotin carboxylase